jgi:hypothetical protein
MERKEVYSIINDERVFQDRKWGTIQERPKQVGSWLTLMRYILTKAEADWSTSIGDYDALDEIRKVVAVGVACMEQHGAVPRNPIDYAQFGSEFLVSKASAVQTESKRG